MFTLCLINAINYQKCGSLHVSLLQVPHYIIMIHNILAHTAHDHVERRSLEFAKSKLEELSQVGVY